MTDQQITETATKLIREFASVKAEWERVRAIGDELGPESEEWVEEGRLWHEMLRALSEAGVFLDVYVYCGTVPGTALERAIDYSPEGVIERVVSYMSE